MWIRNKKTGTLQEIHNADVIKVCKKEPEKYELSEEYPGNEDVAKAAAQAATSKKAEEEAAKKAAEDVAKAEGGDGTGNTLPPEDYNNMKLNDLRKIAKEKGIQGYNNMDKATLVAVIQAH